MDDSNPGLDLDWFLDAADGLLAIPSTADRRPELHRALEYVLDFVGPGFTVQRFESGGKPSALVYAGGRGQRWDETFRVILNGHLDVVPAPAAISDVDPGTRHIVEGTMTDSD